MRAASGALATITSRYASKSLRPEGISEVRYVASFLPREDNHERLFSLTIRIGMSYRICGRERGVLW